MPVILHRRAVLGGLGLAAPCGFAASAAQGLEAAAWSRRAPMPWAIQEIYAAVHGERIVTAGGLAQTPDGLLISDRMASYHPGRDQWEEGPPLPAPRHHPMLAAVGDRLFVMGGYGRSEAGDWTSMTDVWSLYGDWNAGPAMPGPLAETVGLVHGGRVHLVTGRSPAGAADGQWNDQGDVATHYVFDPVDQRWESARPAPMARNSAAGAVMDGALWIAGGRTVAGGGTGRLDRYDPAGDRWDTLAPIPPSPRTGRQAGGGLGMGVLNGRLVAFGGEWFGADNTSRQGGVFAESWIYDPARDAWSEGPPMTTPRHGLAAATVGDAIYAIGGGEVVGGGRASAKVEALSLDR